MGSGGDAGVGSELVSDVSGNERAYVPAESSTTLPDPCGFPTPNCTVLTPPGPGSVVAELGAQIGTMC